MTKTELIKAFASARQRTKAQATGDVDFILDAITQELANGGKVTLTGFGTFSVHERAEKQTHNPRTGEMIPVPAYKAAHFKSGMALRNAVNGSESHED